MILKYGCRILYLVICCGQEEEEEEEEEVTYTEDEEAIIAYLKEDDPLPNELLEKIISDWWKKEPFK